MSDSEKTKEQLIEELKALRSRDQADAGAGSPDSASGVGLTRRDVLSGWVAPVILTVPLIPRSGMAAAEGGNLPGADFAAFPTRLVAQADGPAGMPTSSPSFNPSFAPTANPSIVPTGSPTGTPTGVPTPKPTAFPTSTPTGGVPSTAPPTIKPTSVAPTPKPTTAPTSAPTSSPTSSPTVTIPVELTEFEVNG